MKGFISRSMLAGVAALLFSAAPLLKAQTAPQPPDHDTTRGEVASFDKFLDSHPEVAEDLRKNPNLVDNKQYLQGHPGLRDYLEDHPRVREEVKENPNAFMNREKGFERRERDRDTDTTRGEVKNFDQFLDKHPEVSEDLRKNPGLVNDPNYMKNHPGLRDYLEDHPQVREELKENPKAFMNREKKFEKNEKKDRDKDKDRDDYKPAKAKARGWRHR